MWKFVRFPEGEGKDDVVRLGKSFNSPPKLELIDVLIA